MRAAIDTRTVVPNRAAHERQREACERPGKGLKLSTKVYNGSERTSATTR